MPSGRLKRFLEFLIIGILFGVTEDVLAVVITTDADVTPEMLLLIVLIAVPFAAFSELVVDHPHFIHFDRLADWLKTRHEPSRKAG